MDTGKKFTGAKYHAHRKKKVSERTGQERKSVIGEVRKKQLKTKGGHKKTILLRSDTANIVVDGKVKKTEIKNVEETPQNKFLARDNRLMKGAIILTALGKARITNRPSQEGCVNAVLIEKKE